MINWKEFKKLIGNGKRKHLKKGNIKYHFISWNKETKETTVMKDSNTRTLEQMPLDYFIEAFELVSQGPDKPLF